MLPRDTEREDDYDVAFERGQYVGMIIQLQEPLVEALLAAVLMRFVDIKRDTPRQI